MTDKKISLQLKKSWKLFIYVTQTTALVLFIYLLMNVWSVVGLDSPNSIFLTLVFIGTFLGCIYMILFAMMHKVYFYEDRLTKKGVFTKKTRKYSNLNEVWLSTKMWDMKSPVAILSNSATLVFDYRYANQKEVAEFLTENTNTESLPKLYFNSKDLSL